jgi:hypothetical protein
MNDDKFIIEEIKKETKKTIFGKQHIHYTINIIYPNVNRDINPQSFHNFESARYFKRQFIDKLRNDELTKNNFIVKKGYLEKDIEY